MQYQDKRLAKISRVKENTLSWNLSNTKTQIKKKKNECKTNTHITVKKNSNL